MAGDLLFRRGVEKAADHVPEGVALRLPLRKVEGAGPVDGARREAVAEGGRTRLGLEVGGARSGEG